MADNSKQCFEYPDISACLPFWNSLTAGQRQILISNCVVKRYEQGKDIRFKNSAHNGILLVLEGRVRIYISSPLGREATLFFIEKNKVCVLMTLDGAGEGDAVPSFQADGDCVLASIREPVIRSLMFTCPEVGQFVLSAISDHVQSVLNIIENYTFCPLHNRIARLIIDREVSQECLYPGLPFIRIRHEEIANHLGTTREVVSRVLKSLRDTGAIRTGRGRITILDKKTLAALAGRCQDTMCRVKPAH